MQEKIKTSIMINRELWEELKSRVGGKGSLKALSRAVEEAIEEETGDRIIVEALGTMLGDTKGMRLEVTPVKPKIPTDAAQAVREMRQGAD